MRIVAFIVLIGVSASITLIRNLTVGSVTVAASIDYGPAESAVACTDSDGDGYGDTFFEPTCPQSGRDNCPTVANSDQLDSDGDLIGDACDACVGLSFGFDGDGDIDLRDYARFQNWYRRR